jgi:hypothetical protein
MIGKKINQLATELAPVSTDLTIIGDPDSGVSKKITLAQLGAIFSGAVSFYTNLASFPAVGDINVIYCAKDTQKLYLWSGSAYTEVFPSQALLNTYQLRSEKGVSNGYASLDSGGKVPISQLPSSIMEYKGTWNAATNTPTLANGTGDTGDVYICNVAGTVNFGAGAITFAVGDYTIYSGSIWQRSSGAVGTVTSVAVSRSGDALAITGSPVTTSGTINIGFAGNSTQYINGAGNLVTFPGVINEAQNLITEVYNKTGATLTKGTVVYINGGQGNLPSVTKALATGDSTSAQTYGIVRNDITNNNNGYVVVAGRISDLDTQAYTEGTQLYLSPTTAGTYTSTKPYAPNHLVYVGIVVRAHPTQGVVEVKIQNGYEMDELHNVAAQSPDNNDILQYKTATSLWTKVAGTTSNIAEGSNLYYTDARSRAALSFTAGSGAYNSTTGVITIPTNTNQLTNGAAFITLASLSAGAGISYNNTTGVIASTITQYTDALARAAISLTTSGTSGAATYNSTTGVLNVPQYAPDLSGYVPTSRTLTINGTAYDLSANRSWSVGTVTSVGLSSATSGVTIGSTPITTSGTITLAIATASGSQQGLLSSTDWTTFNNKQNALTNPVTGTGTTNYLPKFTGASTIGNSQIFDNGTNVGIGTATPNTNSRLTISDGTSISAYWRATNTNAATRDWCIITNNANFGDFAIRQGNSQGADATAGTDRLLLSASGNLGLGVTPSAWSSSAKVLEIAATGNFVGSNGADTWLAVNSYLDNVGGGTFRYARTGSFATFYSQSSGSHLWYNAPSGTAGNAISFTQAMTLTASSKLLLNTTSDAGGYQLQSNGSILSTGSGGGFVFADRSTNTNLYTWYATGGSAYIYYSGSASNIFQLASTGAATFSSSVSLTSGYLSVDGFGNKDTNYITMRSGFAPSDSGGIGFKAIDHSGSGTDGLACYGHDGISFYTAQSERMRLDASGNLGLAVTPSAWASGTRALQVGSYGALAWTGGIDISMTNNAYYDGTNWVYIASQEAGRFLNNRNTFAWYQAAAGTAGNAISFTQAMTLDASGRLGIGTTSPGARLDVLQAYASDTTSQIIFRDGTGVALNFGGTASGSKFLQAQDSTGATTYYNLLLNPRGGNVGIGTSSPTNFSGYTTLTVNGTSGGVVNTQYNGSDGLRIGSGTNSFITEPRNTYLGIEVNGSERIRITSGGNVEIATGSIKTGEPDTGWGRAAIKIGARATGEAFNSGGYLPVNVDGTVYYINLYSSTP